MAIIEVDSFYRPLIGTDVIKHRRPHMDKATYDRIIEEISDKVGGYHSTATFSGEEVINIVEKSIKVAIAEELLNRNCCKHGE